MATRKFRQGGRARYSPRARQARASYVRKDRTVLWAGLAGVAVVGVVLFVATERTAPRPARVTRIEEPHPEPESAPVEPQEIVDRRPPESPEASEISTESIVELATVPPPEPRISPPPPSRRKKRKKRKESDDGEAARALSRRCFALNLSGSLGPEALDPDDVPTWTRLGHYLQREAPSRYYLVYPSGKIPFFQKMRPDGKPVKKVSDEELSRHPRRLKEGIPPAYRLVVQSNASAGEGLKFYGTKLAGKYRCVLSGRLEKYDGETYSVVEQFTVDEALTPSSRPGQRAADFLREAHDVAFERLLGKLGRLPLLQASEE